MPTRRQLAGLTVGATAGLALVAAAAPAPILPAVQPDPSPSTDPPSGDPMTLIARRTELTLPELPALGLSYVCQLDLFSEMERQIDAGFSGAERQVGTATAGSMVVGLAPEGPVVLASVVLHLPDGEIHYQRIINRFGGFPRTATGAVLGGTGAYRDARGEVDISWPDEERVDLVVRLSET